MIKIKKIYFVNIFTSLLFYSLFPLFLSYFILIVYAKDVVLSQENKLSYYDPYKNILYDLGVFKISFPKGRFTLQSKNDHFTLSIGTSIQYDFSGFIGPDKEHNQPNMAGFQANLRRGRFIIIASYNDFKIVVAPDIGRAALVNDSMHEANFNYTGFHNTAISIGLIQPSVTMYGSENSAGFTLVERPMVIDIIRNIAAANARIGLSFSHWNKYFFLNTSVTGQRLGCFYQDFQKNQKGGLVRVTFHPIGTTNYDLHLGINSTVAFHGDTRRYSMNSLQEAQIFTGRPYIRTDKLDGVDNVWAIGPEFAFRYKNLILQSEYYSIQLQRISKNDFNNKNLRFSGWYINVNYVLFGKSRHYFIEKGFFAAPQAAVFNPAAGDWGVLEWSIRWSTMNLNSHRYDFRNGKSQGAQGGKQNIIATGFNWYPADQMRFSLEYNYVFATRSRNNFYNHAGRKSNLLISRVEFNF